MQYQYKTTCLQMIQDCPPLYDQLLKDRTLLPTLEAYTVRLRTSHQEWKELLCQENPGSSDSQIASEAMELAVMDLEDYLRSEFPPADSEPFPLDEAMAFVRLHTPPA